MPDLVLGETARGLTLGALLPELGGARRDLVGPSADLFLATLRPVQAADADGGDRIGGWHRKVLGETRR